MPVRSPTQKADTGTPPPDAVEKASVRSASSAHRRPQPHPKEKQRSRPSKLHGSASQPELMQRRRSGRRHNYPIISQLASLKHWFVESAKRAKSPHAKGAGQTGGHHRKLFTDKLSPSKGQDSGKKPAVTSPTTAAPPEEMATPTQVKRASNASSLAPSSASYPNHRHSFPRQPRPLNTSHPSHRNSLSPSPITPKGSYRRSSVGLRGRKSTSSSISSIHSIHHTHTHSKASSVSSNSVGSASTPTARPGKSPHSSLKVLPTTPGASSRFPSNIRLVRGNNNNGYINNGLHEMNDTQGRMQSLFNEAAPAPLLSSPSSSLVFARRKRSAFKGPMIHTANLMVSGGMTPTEYPNGSMNPEESTAPRPTTRKSQIIEEEENPEDEEVEEVEAFSAAEEEPSSPSEVAKPDDNTKAESTDDSASGRHGKPPLAPAPDITSSPQRPPRSSSLRAVKSTAATESTDEDDHKDSSSLTPVASAK